MQRWHPLPAGVYELVERTPGAVLLESAPSGGAASHSRLFLSPASILTASDAASLDALFQKVETAALSGQFAAGFFCYECGNCFEPTTALRPARPEKPLAWVAIYARCYLFDHVAGRFVGGDPGEFAGIQLAAEPCSPQVDVTMGLGADQYAERIAAIHERIRSGDVYQLNFTFPLRIRAQGRAADLYSMLRVRQPVDYGAILNCGSGHTILSFSPELFFRIDGSGATRRIVTRPMKGTAARGRTTAEDHAIAEWLRHDAKNRSENVMIVDLLRNDLGRLCEFGSVRVDELFSVERHPSLWQMTSTISGDLRAGTTYREIFRALFPSGSVTGAPKVRAMQLLAQLEEFPRGVYTGAIGFFSREFTAFNVAIRTIELDDRGGRMGVGSGIVIDSIASDEYRECALKAQFLSRSEEPFQLIETMRWDGEYPLLKLHLDRLQDSAEYFGFVCDRDAIIGALLRIAGGFADESPCKVRLTLAADGKLDITHDALRIEDSRPSQPLRVRIADERTDPANRFLFHKTTNRAGYNNAYYAARSSGFEDVLFLNRDGQVTEGSVSNIFIERDRTWFTPPLQCGILPGVYRRHLLETRPEIEERILTLEDLKAADSVYITNAVSGLRPVVIDWETVAALPGS